MAVLLVNVDCEKEALPELNTAPPLPPLTAPNIPTGMPGKNLAGSVIAMFLSNMQDTKAGAPELTSTAPPLPIRTRTAKSNTRGKHCTNSIAPLAMFPVKRTRKAVASAAANQDGSSCAAVRNKRFHNRWNTNRKKQCSTGRCSGSLWSRPRCPHAKRRLPKTQQNMSRRKIKTKQIDTVHGRRVLLESALLPRCCATVEIHRTAFGSNWVRATQTTTSNCDTPAADAELDVNTVPLTVTLPPCAANAPPSVRRQNHTQQIHRQRNQKGKRTRSTRCNNGLDSRM